MKKLLTLVSSVLLCAAAGAFEPDGTYLFARRDSCDLYLDFYAPAADSLAPPEAKATILFAFGGGFKDGKRDNRSYLPWFKALTERGYAVASIDYRLGLKDVTGAGVNAKFISAMENAINIAVEDMFSATVWLVENAALLGIDPSKIVASGSSAGAITTLQAEWEICNSRELASVLPEGFNYAGVMSFSGAVFSRIGAVRFPVAPCPMLLLHGTADGIVPYKEMALLMMHFSGSDVIAKNLSKDSRGFSILRFKDNGHEIASSMMHNLDAELLFLESNVVAGKGVWADALISDPEIKVPSWGKSSYKSLY